MMPAFIFSFDLPLFFAVAIAAAFDDLPFFRCLSYA